MSHNRINGSGNGSLNGKSINGHDSVPFFEEPSPRVSEEGGDACFGGDALVIGVVVAPPPNMAVVNLPVPQNTLTVERIREVFDTALEVMQAADCPYVDRLREFLEFPWESGQQILEVVDLFEVRRQVSNAMTWATVWDDLPKSIQRCDLESAIRQLGRILRERVLKRATMEVTISIRVSGLPSDVVHYGERLMREARNFTRREIFDLTDEHNNRLTSCACGGIVTHSPGVPERHSFVGDRPLKA